MTTGHVFIASSLDGYIALEDGDISWLTPNGADSEDHGYNAFYATIDAIIMGRGTWEKVSTFGDWPFDKPVIVMSKSLSQNDLPADQTGKVHIWNCTPSEALKRTADEGWSRVYIDGGQLIQSFMQEGLIADLILTRVPVLLGRGKPLFGALSANVPLKHIETRCFQSGMVQSRYEIV